MTNAIFRINLKFRLGSLTVIPENSCAFCFLIRNDGKGATRGLLAFIFWNRKYWWGGGVGGRNNHFQVLAISYVLHKIKRRIVLTRILRVLMLLQNMKPRLHSQKLHFLATITDQSAAPFHCKFLMETYVWLAFLFLGYEGGQVSSRIFAANNRFPRNYYHLEENKRDSAMTTWPTSTALRAKPR